MGWEGITKEFKNIKKKKEILNNVLDEKRVIFKEIKNNKLFFRIEEKRTEDRWDNKFDYFLIIECSFFKEFIFKTDWFISDGMDDYKYYTFKDIKEHIKFNYNEMKLFRIKWVRA